MIPAVDPGPRPTDLVERTPVVIGHRGASGYRPEHTLASYELAARMGADYIEPDLVITADGVLVARHEPEISRTTDVASLPHFADRRATKTVDGEVFTGWFVEDFTLSELRTLRAVEGIPHLRRNNTIYDGHYGIATLDEILALTARLTSRLGRRIGIYAEVKNPTYFAGIGLPLEQAVVRGLRDAGVDAPDGAVVVESFETAFLRTVRDELSVPITQLVESGTAPADLAAAGDPRTTADMVTPEGLADITTYADGLGPDKDLVIPCDADGKLGAPTPLVVDAHAAGLLVHVYTFRNENRFLPADLRRGDDPTNYGDVFREYAAFLAAGVDGMFTDNPDTAVAARGLLSGSPARESWMMAG
ncbi:MAG: glycerophosphoryl diester phosphodiesterase [Pseudonocardiales bacterium]|jgi:glycerophosphoryl diester phosphodiesterase|nr:glycerophosphoryl diester phosphodiesterase [Pseudonocardiales bacterium]